MLRYKSVVMKTLNYIRRWRKSSGKPICRTCRSRAGAAVIQFLQVCSSTVVEEHLWAHVI